MACTKKAVPTTVNDNTYSEDISIWRPKVAGDEQVTEVKPIVTTGEFDPKNDIKAEMDSVGNLLRLKNIQKGYMDGYTIQIYSGRSRYDAREIKKEILEFDDNYEPNLIYKQPDFRVRVGSYFNRLTAHREYVKLRKNFPSAIIIPEKIPID
ncbi:MAG TPA: SPOR domain-containing protein [Cyclobacteriaceae bacterium]